MNIALLTRVTAALGGMFSLAMVLYAGDQSSLFLIGLGLIFGAWAIAPFMLAYFRAPSFSHSTLLSVVLLVATVAAGGFSVFAYWTTFVDNPSPDAQDGLILLFVPLYQIIGMSAVLLAAGWISKFLK